MDRKLNARMQQKIDTYENWSKATNFIPLKGELIIYTTDENGNEKIGFKIGTGELDKNVHQLDFISKDYAFKSDLETKADLVDGKIITSQLPETVASKSDLDNAISVIDSLLASAIGSGVLT